MIRRFIASIGAADAFSRLSTGLKILSIMTIALLPLGILALAASLQANREADKARLADLRIAVSEATRKLGSALGSDMALARATSESLVTPDDTRLACLRIEMTFAARPPLTRPLYALFGPDRAIACATAGFSPPQPAAQLVDARPRVNFAADHADVIVADPRGTGTLILRYRPQVLGELVRPIALSEIASVVLTDGEDDLVLAGDAMPDYRGATDSLSAPVGLLDLSLRITARRQPFSVVEAVRAFLPLLMWASAAIVAFVVTDRLLIRPLGRLRAAIARVEPGFLSIAPQLDTPAREIRELAETFDRKTETIAAHEASIARALADQVKLTREVHHRVKNNLQVVASLISLHARGASPGEVANAYASIQRRVDALAIVHRNHYAELEENHGVSAKALIGELASNLRTGIASSGHAPPVTTSVAAVRVSQDVAAPIAFLVTELFELSITSARSAAIAITLDDAVDTHAWLWIASEAFRTAVSPEGPAPRYARIIDGLARQLRSPLEFDGMKGTYSIRVPILEHPTATLGKN